MYSEFIPTILNFLVGCTLLFSGYKLFWFYVGLLGFILGFSFAEQYLQEFSQLIIYTIGIFSGLLGIFLAIFFQKITIIFTGILLGAYLAISIISNFAFMNEILSWVVLILGGLSGGVIFYLFFNWALIFFTAITGAAILSSLFHPDDIIKNIIFLILFVTGAIIQSKLYLQDASIEE